MLSEGGVLSSLYWWPAVGIMAMVGLGLAWSPFAYAIGALSAKRQNISERDEVGALGVMCSLAMFLPWLYVLSRMLSRPLSAKIIRPVYVLVFTVWLCCLIAGPFGISAEMYFEAIERRSDFPRRIMGFMGVLSAAAVINLFTWQKALRRFIRRCRDVVNDEPWSIYGGAWTVYLEPFVWLIGWSAFNILAIIVMGFLSFEMYS